MSFRKPFRAAPVKIGAHHSRQQYLRGRTTAFLYVGIAAVAGAVIGTGSVVLDSGGRVRAAETLTPIAVRMGVMRARQPQPGDMWSGCNEARSAGTAPIYLGEPGYREGMDGDGDGIACEPYR